MFIVLIGCFVCQMGLGAGYVFGATLKHIVAEFEWSRAAFSAASAPLLAAMALSAPLLGTLAERVGARTVLTASALALGLSLGLFSRMQELWQFYAISVLFGVALTGVGDVVVGAVAAKWAVARRGLVLAVVYLGSNVGGGIVPIAIDRMAAMSSWRGALEGLGLAVIVVIVPFAMFAIREHDDGTQRERPRSTNTNDLDLAEALRTRTFWLLAGVLFSFYFYYLAITQHLIAFLSDVGFSDARAAAGLSFAVALGVFAKLGMGLLSDRIPIKRAALANFGLLTLGSIILLATTSPVVLTVFLVAHGFATAAENVLLPLLVADSFGVTHMAKIYGALMIALLPGGVLGPVFAGAVFDRVGDYRLAFTVFALVNAAGLVALTGIRCERREALAWT
jgi:MFS family permease